MAENELSIVQEDNVFGKQLPPGESLISGKLKFVIAALLVVVSLVSFFPLGDWASSPETHTGTYETLDKQKANVLGLTAAATVASTAITLLPDDIGSSVADALATLAKDFAIVFAAILLEKYLLTLFGWAAFKILIPLACLMLIASLFANPLSAAKTKFAVLAARLALFAVAIFLVVPASVLVSDSITGTYETTINATIEEAQQSAQVIEQATDEDGNVGEGETNNILEQLAEVPGNVANAVSSAAAKVVSGVSGATANFSNMLANFIEGFAVMLVTSCLIPIAVLFLFLWLIQALLGIDTSAATGALKGGLTKKVKAFDVEKAAKKLTEGAAD